MKIAVQAFEAGDFLNFGVFEAHFLIKIFLIKKTCTCHFLTLGFNKPFPDFSFENTIIKNITEEKILVIIIGNNFNFKYHMKKICEKANQKLRALSRISKLITPTQKKNLINSFINAPFT